MGFRPSAYVRNTRREYHDVPDQVRWQAILPHLSRRASERRSGATAQWIRDHVRPERRYPPPPGGPGFRKGALRRVRKSTAQRYYQLLSGHAAIGSLLYDRMTGPQRLDSSVGGAHAAGDSRAITSSRSARHSPLRSGNFGKGLEGIVVGSTRGPPRYAGCGRMTRLGRW